MLRALSPQSKRFCNSDVTPVYEEVTIHATCNNLICCKTGLNVREKRATSLFNLFWSNVAKRVACFCCPLHCSFRQNRELKQQRRRRQRKRHLKSEFALLQTQSRLIHLVQFGKCWQIILEFKSQGLYCSSRKEKESLCLVSTYAFSEKCETGKFHVVIVQ